MLRKKWSFEMFIQRIQGVWTTDNSIFIEKHTLLFNKCQLCGIKIIKNHAIAKKKINNFAILQKINVWKRTNICERAYMCGHQNFQKRASTNDPIPKRYHSMSRIKYLYKMLSVWGENEYLNASWMIPLAARACWWGDQHWEPTAQA